MSYLPETGDWADGIYQFETSDPVQGGPDGIDNVPTKQLANRTSWLRRMLQFGRTTYTPDTGTKTTSSQTCRRPSPNSSTAWRRAFVLP